MEYFSIDFDNDDELNRKALEDDPNHPKKVILLARTLREQSESIIKISQNRWYAPSDANLLDLADDFSAFEDIQAVGVVDETGRVLGMVRRKELFDLLGRPFGRDVLANQTIARVVKKPISFLYHENIYVVSEALQLNKSQTEEQFFILKSDEEDYAGIFSSQDLLMYLSLQTQKDLNLARSIQGHIVPEIFHIEDEKVEIIGSSTMAKGVGGDFYHIEKMFDGTWNVILCDVSGKGVASSLVTCALWGVISAYDFSKGISNLIEKLNSFFNTTFEQEKFVTGIFSNFNSKTKTLVLSDQGHGLGYLLRDSKLFKLSSKQASYPLGIVEDIKAHPHKIGLKENDLVIFVTDGLLEQTRKDGEAFGLDRLQKILVKHKMESLKTIRVKILEEIHSFRQANPVQDDLTFVVLRPK